jgi:hypothetical protein
MSVRQFNGSWSNKDDRIELRFNTSEKQEFCFWLTRFMTIQLINLTDSMVGAELKKRYNNERTADVVQEFQKEKLKSSADFKTTYEGGDSRPLGPDPILLVGLSFTPNDKLIAVELQLDNKKRVNFQLSQEMLISLVLLLETLAEKAGWGIGTSEAGRLPHEQQPPVVVPAAKKVLH